MLFYIYIKVLRECLPKILIDAVSQEWTEFHVEVYLFSRFRFVHAAIFKNTL